VANVKTKLVTLEAQKDTLFAIFKLQSIKLQDYKVNLKNAMGCPRNSNEEIGKIGNFALALLQVTLNGGVISNITPIVKGGASNVWVESHDASNEISRVEACLQHA